MANWCYVKSGFGVRTSATGFSAQESGAFNAGNLTAANCYDSIVDVITYNTLANADYIECSDLHAKSGAIGHITDSITIGGEPLNIRSVDDTNVALYKPGASEETTTAASDFTPIGPWSFYGVDIKCADNVSLASGSILRFNNATLESVGSVLVDTDGGHIILQDSDLILEANTNDKVLITSGSHFEMYGGRVLRSTSGQLSQFSWAGFDSGGGTCRLFGVDLSDGTSGLSATAVVFKGIGSSASSDDAIDILCVGCKITSGATWADEEFASMYQRLRVFGSGVSDDHTFHLRQYGGVVDHETTITRIAQDTMPDGSTKVSAKVTCNTSTNLPSINQPLRFELPVKHGDLSSGGGTQKIRIYFTCDTALDTQKIYAVAGYRDSANATLFNFASSCEQHASSWTINPFASGTSLSTTSSAWNSGKTYEYYLDIDTSGDAGIDDATVAPFVEIYITDAIANPVYISTQIEYVA